MNKIEFLMQALRNYRNVGTVVRSGKWLSKRMASFIKKEDRVIVELGAGDGAITHHILQKMHPDARLYCFEINPSFCEKLQTINDDRLIVIQKSAEDLKEILTTYDVKEADIVISAIPYLVLPEALARQILNQCNAVLKHGAPYLQLHYGTKLKPLYVSIFGNIRQHFEVRNIPPAYVFECRKEMEVATSSKKHSRTTSRQMA